LLQGILLWALPALLLLLQFANDNACVWCLQCWEMLWVVNLMQSAPRAICAGGGAFLGDFLGNVYYTRSTGLVEEHRGGSAAGHQPLLWHHTMALPDEPLLATCPPPAPLPPTNTSPTHPLPPPHHPPPCYRSAYSLPSRIPILCDV